MSLRRERQPDESGIQRLGQISLVTFNAFVQSYLLHEVVHIPKDQQRSLIGTLGFVQESVAVMLVSLVHVVRQTSTPRG